MRISVIIPSYNQAQYLPDAIDSVLNQIEMPDELIIVDDGSSDGSLQIAQGYQKQGIKFGTFKLISQVNKGLASARNTAIMNLGDWLDYGDDASEHYVLPLDADDILKENCIEKIMKVAKKTRADIIAPSITCFGIGNETTILMENPTLEDFKAGNRIPYCSAIKKEALLEVGGYSPRMDKGWEDLALWYDLLTRGKTITTIQEPLVLYRTKKESMWIEARDKYKDVLQAQIDKDFPDLWNN